MTGECFINSKDAFTHWGVSFDKGALDALMMPPPMKPYTENKSRAVDGKIVSVTNPRLDERSVQMVFSLQASDLVQFRTRLSGFMAELQSGWVNLTTKYEGDVKYRLLYVSCSQFTQFNGRLGKFILKFEEPNPANRERNIMEECYGIEWDETISSSSCTRIGNLDLHRSLPIQSGMKRCLLLDNGSVNYYTSNADTTLKEDGTSSVLDGTDGQVMVEIPAHWRKFESEGTRHRVLICEYQLPGFHFVPKAYRSAYQPTVDRSNPSVPKLASVMNTTPQFRGGNNNLANDQNYNTLLGMPATALSLLNFRAYARNRGVAGMNGVGWNCELYEFQKTVSWLYFVEYANFNCQLAFNAEPDANGYKQGGLGAGVTNLSWTDWGNYNGYYPFVPCGYTNALGNATGVVPFTFAPEAGIQTQISVPSYRGIENPFGHIWHWTDGVLIKNNSDEEGGEREFFTCENPALFHSTDFENYIKRGNIPTTQGYIKSILLGEFGETMPRSVGGSSTTYFADYYYCNDKPASGSQVRGVLVGGCAVNGSAAGLSCSLTANAVSYTAAHFGSRLCFKTA